MDEILYVSKPIAPPWNDSSKNLVWSLAQHLEQFAPRVMTYRHRDAASPVLPFGVLEPVFRPTARYAFGSNLRQQLEVLLRLRRSEGEKLLHFFFAPNPKSSWMARAVLRARRLPSVQTVCSVPKHVARWKHLAFADVHVVLSRYTEQLALQAGLRPDRIARIPPCVPRLEPSADRDQLRAHWGVARDAPVLVYPGDLEFGGGAERCIHLLTDLREHGDATLMIAARPKTPLAIAEEHRLKDLAHRQGVSSRVQWVGETDQIHSLLQTADVVLLPADSLYAKMDYPLVVLEAMALGRPVVVASSTPAAELVHFHVEDGESDASSATPAAVPSELTRESLRQTVNALLTDTARRTALGHAARRLVTTHFTPAVMARHYERIYQQLL
jgi:glycosyltransferase involved in cell wall biosynthesis